MGEIASTALKGLDLPTAALTIAQERGAEFAYMGYLPLSSLFQLSSSLCASDPRDIHYGRLGLIGWPEHRKDPTFWLKVDYRKPVSSVFRDATIAAIAQFGELDVLTDIERARPEGFTSIPDEFSSWALRFDKIDQKLERCTMPFAARDSRCTRELLDLAL